MWLPLLLELESLEQTELAALLLGVSRLLGRINAVKRGEGVER